MQTCLSAAVAWLTRLLQKYQGRWRIDCHPSASHYNYPYPDRYQDENTEEDARIRRLGNRIKGVKRGVKRGMKRDAK